MFAHPYITLYKTQFQHPYLESKHSIKQNANEILQTMSCFILNEKQFLMFYIDFKHTNQVYYTISCEIVKQKHKLYAPSCKIVLC